MHKGETPPPSFFPPSGKSTAAKTCTVESHGIRHTCCGVAMTTALRIIRMSIPPEETRKMRFKEPAYNAKGNIFIGAKLSFERIWKLTTWLLFFLPLLSSSRNISPRNSK
ncbi:hypothetical protein CEXT_685171 [Caerostris extrusa]|uniref:Uncharacterized protein n=1 Tax=Caerostris extrusa TaxID=172846 RepID=A0AAV4R2T0_CAEEX|nr:hypothetical protein CEXT_685171 [Caerostris extrusa]